MSSARQLAGHVPPPRHRRPVRRPAPVQLAGEGGGQAGRGAHAQPFPSRSITVHRLSGAVRLHQARRRQGLGRARRRRSAQHLLLLFAKALGRLARRDVREHHQPAHHLPPGPAGDALRLSTRSGALVDANHEFQVVRRFRRNRAAQGRSCGRWSGRRRCAALPPLPPGVQVVGSQNAGAAPAVRLR